MQSLDKQQQTTNYNPQLVYVQPGKRKVNFQVFNLDLVIEFREFSLIIQICEGKGMKSGNKSSGRGSPFEMGFRAGDKENRKVLANLRVNNLNKDLEDAHLFKLSKKNLFHDKHQLDDQERTSRTTMSSSFRQIGRNQTGALLELLKDEITKKYESSEANRLYWFPANEEDSESSIQSLENVTNYDLNAQNKAQGADEIESLLSRLVTIVNKSPTSGSILKQKNSTSHRLFCELLKNVAAESKTNLKKISVAQEKKSRDKINTVISKPKLPSSFSKTPTNNLIGRLHIKSKADIPCCFKSNRRENSPKLQDYHTQSSQVNLKESFKPATARDLTRSGSGKLFDKKLHRKDKPERNQITQNLVKKIIKTSHATHTGNNSSMKDERSNSRKKSPEAMLCGNKTFAQEPSKKTFTNLSKKIYAQQNNMYFSTHFLQKD